MKGVVNMTDKMENLLERLIVLNEMELVIRYTELVVEKGEFEKDEQVEAVDKILDRYTDIFGSTIMNTKENFGE